MKNVRETMMKKCLFIEGDEFQRLVRELTDGKVYPTFTLEGIDYECGDDVDFGNAEMIEMLSEHFDVEVTSLHMDDCDYVGVWICYKEK